MLKYRPNGFKTLILFANSNSLTDYNDNDMCFKLSRQESGDLNQFLSGNYGIPTTCCLCAAPFADSVSGEFIKNFLSLSLKSGKENTLFLVKPVS